MSDYEALKGKVLNPGDLVAYQDGSVVSRMLAFSSSGTVTIFAFSAGEGLSEHTAPFDAILYVLEGEVRVVIDGVSHQLKCGELIIMPADIPHAVYACTDFKMMLIMIHA
ncbi:MAG: cupin domain-containing protein [Methanomicrobiales archaeon]|jgi:quercetin dioxygenase-like cupin family protein|nr:cupin domain-containing protein [Methanomicrobiales archaeon]